MEAKDSPYLAKTILRCGVGGSYTHESPDLDAAIQIANLGVNQQQDQDVKTECQSRRGRI